MTSSSASSIVELSRSKQRYHDQDALLKGFIGMPGCTAKEIAVEVLDWKYEQYANSPKRAFDLDCLGYLEKMPQKLCRHTGKMAHSYRVAEKGLEHLRKQGVETTHHPVPVAFEPESHTANVRQKLSEMRGLLGVQSGKR